jgi:hypothetical protein
MEQEKKRNGGDFVPNPERNPTKEKGPVREPTQAEAMVVEQENEKRKKGNGYHRDQPGGVNTHTGKDSDSHPHQQNVA